MGNVIAALALCVSGFAAAWVVLQDLGKFRQLERYGNALQAATIGSLERDALQSVFDRLALPLALGALAAPRRRLRGWAWVLLSTGVVAETLWIMLIIVGERGALSWWVYGVGLALLLIGSGLRGIWRELRLREMRAEMNSRRVALDERTRIGAITSGR